MTPNDIPWELHRSFLALVRHRSLSGAARALGLTQPTLGRHLDQLEARLGAPLFVRSPQGLAPTETALALAPIAEAMASAADALARVASDKAGEITGAVRITASEVIGAEVLPAILADFADRHPGIVFELNLTNQTEDLLRRDADIAVRMVRPTQSALVAKKLGETWLGLYAHRGYLGNREPPKTLQEAAACRLIGFDRYPVPIQAIADAGISVKREMFSLRTDNDLAHIAAIRAGYGIGACQIGIARRDPNLVRVAEGAFTAALEMWLVMHEDLRASARIRAVYDHLAEALAAYSATSR
jgi:DNA-binding transcriptional LysR family regulator